MRSIRLRFFLVTWPLVLLATAGVALAFDRWAGRELRLLDERIDAAAPPELGPALEIVEGWADGELDLERVAAELGRIAGADSVSLAVVDTGGGLVVGVPSGLRLEESAADSTGLATFTRSRETEGGMERYLVQVVGTAVTDRNGVDRGRLFVLPPVHGPPPGELGPLLRADARRTLLVSLAAAALVSALLALLLAGPMARQIERLAGAVGRVGAGDLAARVAPGSDDELGRLERGFNAMAEGLERAELQKRNLVGDVAHELRTPLTNISGTLEAIDDGLRRADGPTLDALRREVRLLTALVDDLQDLSLAESGQLRFESDAVDVAALVHDVLVAVGSRGVDVDLVGPDTDGPPIRAIADGLRLSQAVRNLVANAVTHTPGGGRVAVHVARTAAEVVIEVNDTGRGIPPEELPHVWERFRRVDPSRDRRRGGSGLGLAIVQQFVEGMGGRVGAESRLGEGSTFRIRLPRAPGEG